MFERGDQVIDEDADASELVGTDRPGLQFYTGNMLAGANRGRDGTHPYRQGDGFTPTFASSVLRPGETFRSTTVYRFGAR